MPRRTAVAAPPAEPFDELFAVLDKLTVRQLTAFIERVRKLAGR